MFKSSMFPLLLLLSSCSTGGGGTVFPSPLGDLAVSKACKEALPDILTGTPITMNAIWLSEGRGSAADGLEGLRMGFERVSYDVTPAHLVEANALSTNDTSRWSLVPLTGKTGHVSLEVAARGDARCTAFEREVSAQRNSTDPKANTDDPMKFWTDTRYPPAPPEGRNWCIATRDAGDTAAPRYTRTVTNFREGQSTVTVMLDLLTGVDGGVLARRTQVVMYRPSFPIGVSSVGTGCDGRTIGPIAEFWGPSGIAFRPASAPTLVNK